MKFPIWSVLWIPVFLLVGIVALVVGSSTLAFAAIIIMSCGPVLSVIDIYSNKEANNATK